MHTGVHDLTVKGESIERIFLGYRLKNYKANRRYQRKLVWGLEEKRSFINSIMVGYPVPIILLAEDERADRGEIGYEIIDGMQRLNAITSFIENDYHVDGKYFDLNAMAATKALLDEGKLVQRQPMHSRATCVGLVSYELPVSIFEYEDGAHVDEVFRRINSGGRKLSRQELRAAGSVGDFPTAVRRISANIRGDSSRNDVVALNDMKNISIATRDLGYGIPVESVFWVKHGILAKEDVRQSQDEQLVADMLAYTLLDSPPPSRSELLDDYYGFGENEGTERQLEINRAVQKRGLSVVEADFATVIDAIDKVTTLAGKGLTSVLYGSEAQWKAPRVFQVVFLALHHWLVKNNREVISHESLLKKLTGSGNAITVQEGGKWGAEHRQRSIDSNAGLLAKSFKKRGKADPAKLHWISQFENLLANSFTEQNCYDFKQGFLNLADTQTWDANSFEKILKTCVGIANAGTATKGYLIIGVSDKESTTQRVKEKFGIDGILFNRFSVLGIEHEAKLLKKSLDDYFKDICSKIRKSPLSEELRLQILNDVKLIRYHDRAVLVLEVMGQTDPCTYDGEYFVREGANLRQLERSEYPALFKRFYSSRS